MTVAETLDLLDWKRRIFALYAEVRAAADPRAAWQRWRDTRDDLFRTHPQSPLPAEERNGFAGLQYYEYDPHARVLAELSDLDAPPAPIETSGREPMIFRPFAAADFELRGEACRLEVQWLEGYGGGVFLSFRDATSGRETHGGGRYLYDTVKGADLGNDGGRLVLDFNFAYNPSCAYDPGWVCPLAPPANRLAVAVGAGERHAA
ncbi:MAG: DUF1684 domain-containing protein [Actinobacteria bacterium]|nr:DUF1684 domain-containing protein [Actinomycetota bacterium]